MKHLKSGDWILAIDEALNFKRKIRIIQLEEQFDVTGKRIGYTATCGDLSIVDQYTHLQSSLDSKVQRIQESVDNALSSANGKSTNYYGEKEPTSANEGDLWFDQSDSDPDKWSIKQWVNGRWEQITLNPGEVDAKVDVAKKEAETAVENAKSASDKADQLAAKYDDTNALANQALSQAVGAQSDASIAVATANSTASGFGKVDQKADSALTAALNAQTNASTAVTQASSAAADSKDAKQIAGAVSQSYKTLTDGSTMTIAELENGLATKLTKTDLDGYATQTWTQNQIKVTADGINATMSSIKSTVDGQTTSINDLKADSSSFKSQFTTVNNTLGKQTTDISTLQATSKELTSGFNTLTTDNATNKNDISQLRQTATELNSTIMTVQTQVQNSAVGTNLLLDSQTQTRKPSWYTQNNNWTEDRGTYLGSNIEYIGGPWGNARYSYKDLVDRDVINTTDYFTYSIYFRVVGEDPAGMSYAYIDFLSAATTKNGTVPLKLTTLKEGQWARIVVPFKFMEFEYDPTKDYNYSIRIEMSAAPKVDGARYEFAAPKLEKGSVATDYSVSPEDTATVTAFSKLSQTVDGMQLDISKKLEQTYLDGYATQTWAQNQIKLTSDSLSATLSSVKSAVDGHTTSINALQADSSGFKAQFTTVNNTLGKHTTDIGTLQSTTKSLSASFDSLNADNATNKHNISQLQLTANSFSSTLATVQQQVTDSAVGTNLLANTADNGIGPVSIQGDTSDIVHSGPITRNSSYLEMTSTGASELYYRFSNTNASMHNLKPGQTYTIQGEVYVNKGDVRFRSQFQSNGGWGDYSGSVSGNLASNTSGFTKVKYTFTIPENATAVYISWQVFNFDSSTVFRFRRMKLEIGRVATDYSTSPLDNATITALSSISQTVDTIQTTVRGKVDNDTYQSKMTQIDNAIITKVSKGDVTNDNILPYSGYWSDTTGWNLFAWGASDKTLSLVHHDFYHNAADATLCIQTTQNATAPVGSSKFTLIPNTTYTFSFWGFASSNVVGTNVYILGRSYTSTKDYDFVHAVFENLKMSPSGINKYTATFKTGPTETQAYIRLDNGGSNNGQSAGSYFAELKLEQGDTATPYTRVSSGEVQITSDNINLKVSKDGVINAINISREGTLIYGNKLHITADTYIDNAVIKDAMIANLSANKLTAGSINAANINVYNINGANIVSNSITADKIQAGSMLLAMNSTLQTLKIGTDGLYTTNTSGAFIGKIHANNLIEHPNDWGVHFDLAAGAQYMAWGAQNSNDPNGGYVVKFGWTRNSSAGDFTLPWGGFWFNDNVMLHKNLSFDGGGIDVKDAYQLMKFAWIEMNGTKYPFFGSSNLKAGWLFGSSETYLVRNGGIINASKILGILNGQHYKFIKDLNSNGTVKGYVDVNF
ncbi:gp58-like family protein [Lactiplantibacillus plantarum]|uniref:gp58-like family protein n=1 Tax=Lactiplantibacillus plantarum TaxID=1590 RepID=UPI0009414907|nr:gp58-like family protein [Lactiplantibacillus plantarum]